MRINALTCALTLAGCAAQPQPVGLNYGDRFAWLKDGSDANSRQQMFACASRDNGTPESVANAANIPIAGLFIVVAGASDMRAYEAARHACMNEAGYRLFDLRRNVEMRSNGWTLVDAETPGSR